MKVSPLESVTVKVVALAELSIMPHTANCPAVTKPGEVTQPVSPSLVHNMLVTKDGEKPPPLPNGYAPLSHAPVVGSTTPLFVLPLPNEVGAPMQRLGRVPHHALVRFFATSIAEDPAPKVLGGVELSFIDAMV